MCREYWFFGTPHGGKAHRPAGRRWSRLPRSRTASWSITSFSNRLHSTLPESGQTSRRVGKMERRLRGRTGTPGSGRDHASTGTFLGAWNTPLFPEFSYLFQCFQWVFGESARHRLRGFTAFRTRIFGPDIRYVSRSRERISSPERRDRERRDCEQRDRERRGAWYAK